MFSELGTTYVHNFYVQERVPVKFCVRKTVLLGMGPLHILAGDLTCVLSEARTIFSLRKYGAFMLWLRVEGNFIGGCMRGSAIEDAEVIDVYEEGFIIQT
jgi:hypothetical protein